jgi:hypothetical protein
VRRPEREMNAARMVKALDSRGERRESYDRHRWTETERCTETDTESSRQRPQFDGHRWTDTESDTEAGREVDQHRRVHRHVAESSTLCATAYREEDNVFGLLWSAEEARGHGDGAHAAARMSRRRREREQSPAVAVTGDPLEMHGRHDEAVVAVRCAARVGHGCRDGFPANSTTAQHRRSKQDVQCGHDDG